MKTTYDSNGVTIEHDNLTLEGQGQEPDSLYGPILGSELLNLDPKTEDEASETEGAPSQADGPFLHRMWSLVLGDRGYSRFGGDGKGKGKGKGKASTSNEPTATLNDYRRSLGWFAGVMAPVALGQFASNIFLRTGFVVGQAGLIEAYSMLVLAYFILVLTVLSISAISTNGAVEGGGAYYMIGRALGPEFGGSIGVLFYFANVFSCALYTTGFVEGMVQNFGVGGTLVTETTGLPMDSPWWRYLYATVSVSVCFLICVIGGEMFARTSAFILMVVVLCTVSVVISVFVEDTPKEVDIPKTNHLIWKNQSSNATETGLYTALSATTFRDNLYSDYQVDYSTGLMMNYATVFAILFSSVTGILNGANMSGELKDPAKAIPKGTMGAVITTFWTYMIMTTVVAGTSARHLLVNNYVFLQDVNIWPPFVVIGIFAATLSAALANLIGASRVLEALGNDHLYWSILKPATWTTKGGNPIIAVIISWGLVQLVLLIGSLNEIAPVTSVFFLLSYASTNLACLALELASAPNFRPTFNYFSWHTCVLGIVGCLLMCFLISPLYTSVSLVLMLLLVILLHFRSLPSTWGSISQALIFHQVRKYLLMLDLRKSHVKYWRPQLLVMVANPRQSCELLEFCNDLKKSGLYVLGHVKTGNLESCSADPILEETPHWLNLIQTLKLKAFAELTLAPTVSEGFQHLVRLSGLGGMKVNTVCFGFHDDHVPTDTMPKRSSSSSKMRKLLERGRPATVDVETFFDVPRANSANRLDKAEYVKLIQDALKMQKNVLLFRNFQAMNKEVIMSQSTKSYIDVWPVNFFRPYTSSYFDNTCLFLLQLGCILNMQTGWKKHTQVRVFLCVKSVSENTASKEQKLSKFLKQLRIHAKIVVVPWERLEQYLQKPPTSEPQTQKLTAESDEDEGGTKMHEFAEVPDEYIQAASGLIQNHSTRTSVTFMYLPRPPVLPELHDRYLKQLAAITDWGCPTVLVHGLHPVTSTTL